MCLWQLGYAALGAFRIVLWKWVKVGANSAHTEHISTKDRTTNSHKANINPKLDGIQSRANYWQNLAQISDIGDIGNWQL